MDPNDRQVGLLMQHCGWARTASNWAIDAFKAAWFAGEGQPNEWLTDVDLRKMFNQVKLERFPWSRDLSQIAAKNAIIHTGDGLKKWGAYCRARKAGQPARRVGFPKYRKRGRHMAYTASNGRNTVRPDGRRVHLPKVGTVRMRESLRFEGDITEVTISLYGGRWHAAFTVDTGEPEPAKHEGETVGIDMGLTVLATPSDGDPLRIRRPWPRPWPNCEGWTRPLRGRAMCTARIDRPSGAIVCTNCATVNMPACVTCAAITTTRPPVRSPRHGPW